MIDLQLLGGLDILGSDLSANARARRRHPMVLLALVAAAAPQSVSRDRIMAMLWPESDADRASNSLRQALHALRRDLGEALFLPDATGSVRLDPRAISVDLWTFRDAVARRSPEEAVAAYRGPFLDGVHVAQATEFARWAEEERLKIRRDYLAALEQLGRAAEESGRYDDAVMWRRKQATVDPCSSRAALGLLRALTMAGDRSGALAYAAVHENFLRAHLDVETEPVVTEFVEALRRGSPPPGLMANRPATPPAAVAVVAAVAAVTPVGAVARVEGASRGDVPPHMTRRQSRPSRFFALGLAAIALVGVGGGYTVFHSDQQVMVLASGTSPDAGRDTSDVLVSCKGPACPSGSMPKAAYVVPKHVAYAVVAPATAFIAPVSDGTTIGGRGYACCSTAVFERTFRLPDDATSATITIDVAADNRAIVAVNGVEFGRQADSLSQWNFDSPPATYTATFLPDPSGVNRLRVTLWDGGGVLGLNYRAIIAYARDRGVDSSGR